MINVLLVLNIIVVVLLIGIILLQKSEGGVLGIGGGSRSAMFSAHAAGSMITKITYGLAAAFFAICMALAVLIAKKTGESKSFIESMAESTREAEAKEVRLPQVNKIPESSMPEAGQGMTDGNTAGGAIGGEAKPAKKPTAPRN